jgi:hypothetical protein
MAERIEIETPLVNVIAPPGAVSVVLLIRIIHVLLKSSRSVFLLL